MQQPQITKLAGLILCAAVMLHSAPAVYAADHSSLGRDSHDIQVEALSFESYRFEDLQVDRAPEAAPVVEIELQNMGSFNQDLYNLGSQLSQLLSLGDSNKSTGTALQQLHHQVFSTLSESPQFSLLMENGLNELQPSHGVESDGLRSQHFQRYHQGLEVIGETMIVLEAGDKASLLLATPDLEINTIPTLDASEAMARARFHDDTRPVQGEATLKVLPVVGQPAQLVYQVVLGDSTDQTGANLLINAHTGELVSEEPHAVHIAPVRILSAKNAGLRTHPRTGAPLEFEFNRMQVAFQNNRQEQERPSPSALQARDNARSTLQYYEQRLGRRSFDGRNSELVSVVHIGRNFSNAFWHTTMNFMAYGDGGRDFTAALDVAGHEMTHGVVNSTVKFRRNGEPGALNEAYSDFFGEMIELTQQGQNDWLLGRDLYRTAGQQQGGRRYIRNIINPRNNIVARVQNEQGQARVIRSPSSYGERLRMPAQCTRQNNFCWVHVNSTLWSHAGYKIYQAIGRRKAERLMYLTMIHALRPSSGFLAAGRATRMVCERIYTADDCQKVHDTLASGGL